VCLLCHARFVHRFSNGVLGVRSEELQPHNLTSQGYHLVKEQRRRKGCPFRNVSSYYSKPTEVVKLDFFWNVPTAGNGS